MEKKPSWKSTAFWVVAINTLISLLAALQGLISPQVFTIISACLAAAFAFANAISKLAPPPPAPGIPADYVPPRS